eukprot:TRINITY_DN10594_c0_g1_i9.p1 TRINITY_DN10594_c0_g1~~TRINITY_DN10594_c0_g1_i9.p1  ORF type:complete len:118 (+),score=11.18 TRINITY_DN10594_c0_g1_i9:342-695(+)
MEDQWGGRGPVNHHLEMLFDVGADIIRQIVDRVSHVVRDDLIVEFRARIRAEFANGDRNRIRQDILGSTSQAFGRKSCPGAQLIANFTLDFPHEVASDRFDGFLTCLLYTSPSPRDS